MAKYLVYVILILFFFQECSSQNTKTLSISMDVEKIIKNIDKNKSLKIIVIDDYEGSSEGKEIMALYDDQNRIHKFTSTQFGDMGKITTTYYLYADSLVYQKRVFYKYDKPFYMKPTKTEIDSVKSNCIVEPLRCDFNAFRKELKIIGKKLSH